jgi:hypothetical protein
LTEVETRERKGSQWQAVSGARAAQKQVDKTPVDPIDGWATGDCSEMGCNSCALAKHRIAWVKIGFLNQFKVENQLAKTAVSTGPILVQAQTGLAWIKTADLYNPEPLG